NIGRLEEERLGGGYLGPLQYRCLLVARDRWRRVVEKGKGRWRRGEETWLSTRRRLPPTAPSHESGRDRSPSPVIVSPVESRSDRGSIHRQLPLCLVETCIRVDAAAGVRDVSAGILSLLVE